MPPRPRPTRAATPPIPMPEAAQAYQAGASVRTLADRYGRSYGSVWKALRAQPDVDIRPWGGSHKPAAGRTG